MDVTIQVKGAELPAADPDLGRQRQVVDAFFQVARGGDFGALLAVLNPDVVVRYDIGSRRLAASVPTHGAAAIARLALTYAHPTAILLPVLVNGAVGVVILVGGPYL